MLTSIPKSNSHQRSAGARFSCPSRMTIPTLIGGGTRYTDSCVFHSVLPRRGGLTPRCSSHRLINVRRVLASFLVAALVAAPGVVSSLHVHEYTGHDHPTHHHGPASHEHGPHHSPLTEPDHDHDATFDSHGTAAVSAESCDPGRHAVAVKMGCAQPPQLHLDLAERPGPTIAVPTIALRSAVGITDVRVHGPPFDPRIPSRAPPLTPHA